MQEMGVEARKKQQEETDKRERVAKEKELMKGLDFVNDVRLKIHVE